MTSQQLQTLDAADRKMIFALLVHPRLVGIRRQFEDCVAEVLGDERELETVSQAIEVPLDEVKARTRRMLLDIQTDRACRTDSFGETADIALAFFATPRFINVWGHFTMALQKIMVDDLTMGEVAALCSAGNIDQVRSAIRQFSSDSSQKS